MAKILLVDDDKELLETVQLLLSGERHTVETAATGEQGLELMRFSHYDLVILDWSLPDTTGVDICKRFRSAGGSAPILMLTGKASVLDKESGLDAGADDYLTKPFHVKELTARIRALLRRPAGMTSETLSAGAISLEPGTFKATVAGRQVQLHPKEFALLEFFVKYADRYFTAETLIDRIWPSDSEISTDAVRQLIKRLRSKIDTDGEPSRIRTTQGLGYKLDSR